MQIDTRKNTDIQTDGQADRWAGLQIGRYYLHIKTDISADLDKSSERRRQTDRRTEINRKTYSERHCGLWAGNTQ